MWRQAVWGTAIAIIGVATLVTYLAMQPSPDNKTIRFLAEVLVLMPVLFGVAYLIGRPIERAPD